ncbi:MAG: GNAT family N-acetyltransferase [Hyphomicrobiales bacterium]|nr:GNAT family N-acetyltransferase [Hyphomicrobiales bacterium]
MAVKKNNLGDHLHPQARSRAACTVRLARLERLERFDSFAPLRKAWCALQRDAEPAPFQTLEWCENWYATAGAARGWQPALIAGYAQGGALVLLLPLMVRRFGPVGIARPLGDRNAGSHAPLLAPGMLSILSRRDIEQLSAKLKALLPGIDLLVLGDQPERLHGRSSPWLGLTHMETGNALSQMQLGADWRKIDAAHRSAKSRSKERNRENGLKRLGHLEFCVADTAQERGQMFAALCDQKSAWFRAAGLPDLLADEATRAFLRSIALLEQSETAPSGVLTGLRLDGDFIALNMGVVHRDHYAGLMLSTAEGETRRHSPGHLLITRTLQHAAQTGITQFSFGSGESDIKRRWADQRVGLYLCTAPYTAKGRACEAGVRGFAGLRQLVKSNPRLWRYAERFRRFRTLAPQMP